MNKRSALLLIIAFLFHHSTANALDRIENISAQLNQIFQCPERIWPGLQAEGFQIVFVQPSIHNAWLWSAKSGETTALSKIDKKEIPIFLTPYLFEDFRKERVVFINLDVQEQEPRVASILIDSAANLSFHEGFHYLFQMKKPWLSHFSGVERKSNINYINALYFRKMLIRTLKDALLTGRPLGYSAYWLQKWQATGEEEETKFSDILEGTANYAEIVASVIASHGCQVSEEVILKTIFSNLDSLVNIPKDRQTQKEFFQEYKATGYQIEGYEIGLLALANLRSNGKIIGKLEYPLGRDYTEEINHVSGNPEKMKIMNELMESLKTLKTPVQLLLQGIEPIKDQDDPVLLESIRASANK